MKLVIKGAIYTDGDLLLMPHFTGEFSIVDCTEFKTKKEIKQEYSKQNAKDFLDNYPLTYDNEQYYECEYSSCNTDNLELLSDLSELEHLNEETNF